MRPCSHTESRKVGILCGYCLLSAFEYINVFDIEEDVHMEELQLFDYAFCGASEGFAKMIDYLASIAEEEKWSFDDNAPNIILHKYIKGTFKQCYAQGKILLSDDKSYSCFNTGLLTKNGNDIVAMFSKNTKADAQEWYMMGYKDITERQFLNTFNSVPEIATYTENYEQYYFNPNYPIVLSTDHILDDNWERIKEIVPLSKSIVKGLLVGVVEESKKRVQRNLRLVIPQFYNNQIMYLLPIQIPVDDDKYETMALAIELTATKQYRANTIFTKAMAYEKARLLMKPESNWLI